MDKDNNRNTGNKKRKKVVWLIVTVLCLAVAAGAGFTAWRMTHGKSYDFDKYKTETEASDTVHTDNTAEQPSTETEIVPELPDSYVDFDALKFENPDIYAWITIPGTKVDYPIVQSETSEEYYLRRDYLGNPDVCGCIFTQYLNKKDFSDRNTVIYGHYMANKTFFGGLHDYKSMQFMIDNPNIIIYIPGHKLTYEIFSAYEYDDRHILKSFDFRDDEEYSQYLDSCLNPMTVTKTVKEGVTLTTQDKIVTLSTCVPSGAEEKRYLVQGVLRSDEMTK